MNNQKSQKDKVKTSRRKTRQGGDPKPAPVQKTLVGKRTIRGKLNLAKLFYQEFEDDEHQNYLTHAAKPSIYPPRKFCSVCNYFAEYQCTRCGLRTCSLKCDETHRETKCIKFAD